MKEAPQYAYPKTQKLIESVLADPNDPIGQEARHNVRATNITGIYFFSPATHRDIADIYDISIERSRQIVQKTTNRMWKYLSPELHRQLPWSTIPLDKPLPIRARRRMSLAQGGLTARAEALVLAGKSTKEIKKKLHLSGSELARVRRRLSVWDIELPYLSRPKHFNLELAKKLARSRDDGEIHQLFGHVNRAFYHRDRESGDRVLVPLKKIAKGLIIRNDDIHFLSESLERSGIPFCTLEMEVKSGPQKGIVSNYLIVRQCRKRAWEAWRSDPQLDRFRHHNKRNS